MRFSEHVQTLNAYAEQLRQSGEVDPRFSITRSKLGNRELCQKMGFPCSELYHQIQREELEEKHLDRPCVLKPLRGTAAIGCQVLDVHPGIQDAWFNLRTGHWLGISAIRKCMHNVHEQKAWWGEDWLIEELLRPVGGGQDAPVEYMVFTFGGLPELIVGRSTQFGHTRSRWFDNQWEETDIGRGPSGLDRSILPPSDPEGVLSLASQVALAVPFEFVRVDLYDSSRGLVVGEINDHTGTLNFSPEWEERMGNAWDRALKSRG